MMGRPPPPRSPQEKKALSYAKDRRNSYGENDKGARKTIPNAKARENRGNRRKLHQELTLMPKLDEAEAVLVESSARHDVNRVGGWQKIPDMPLGEHVAHQKAQRARRQAGTDQR
jgi:hypothetical protein